VALDLNIRKHLAELAVEEYDWIDVDAHEGASAVDLQWQWPQLDFTIFSMNGADDFELLDISSTHARKALAVQDREVHPKVIEWFTQFDNGLAMSLDRLSTQALATVIDKILVSSLHFARRTDRRMALICAFEAASLDEAALVRLGAAAAAEELKANATKRIPKMAFLEAAFEEWLASTTALNPVTAADKRISQTKGSWRLLGKSGDYTYDKTTGDIKTSDSSFVGCFSFMPISEQPLPISDGKQELPCIGITDSEIILEVGKPDNHEAFFVLPSQLNGADYPSHRSTVMTIGKYCYDDTGGPRGQLSVHPAVGQFVLDNAACETQTDGINAVDQVIARLNKHGLDFKLVNGYLQVPACDADESEQALKIIRETIHTLRPLVRHNVEASGADPSLRLLTNSKHRVNLVYASAVPVDSYLNSAKDRSHYEFMVKVAETVLYAQYYEALKHAAARGPPTAGGKRTVYMMPLWWRRFFFQNPTGIIVSAMSCAVET